MIKALEAFRREGGSRLSGVAGAFFNCSMHAAQGALSLLLFPVVGRAFVGRRPNVAARLSQCTRGGRSRYLPAVQLVQEIDVPVLRELICAQLVRQEHARVGCRLSDRHRRWAALMNSIPYFLLYHTVR